MHERDYLPGLVEDRTTTVPGAQEPICFVESMLRSADAGALSTITEAVTSPTVTARREINISSPLPWTYC
ncbi:hypothetical protein HYPDE_26623 [Hyphomicrobium denitrificans 1NES1]|uniref:Uncharacterized protein n=1 Tax=Hyphomicrobium denitrificans 1NES1 TaxID=670307 RepID=N0BA91_9HYPH|nr:hypothetical protein HYPDE_26623 [Hyphomicrobium denitrificans 1NES1]